MSEASETLQVLKEIRDEMRELRDAFDAFSNGGFPLKQSVPSTETMAALICTAALLLRDNALTQADLQHRTAAAMTLSTNVLSLLNQYLSDTQMPHLESLLKRDA